MQTRLRSSLAALLVALILLPTGAWANPKYAAYVIHADTGDILFDRYSTKTRFPASLTKMMTLYMLFEAIEAGELELDSQMTVSKTASLRPASRLGLKRGSKIDVETAIQALIIKSANDVATVVAEELGGSEAKFARQMTKRARELGMRRTTFRNASGLPNSKQRTTARDMAILSQRVVQDFPQYYHYFDDPSFSWNGTTYKSHNKVTKNFNGADGLKTGYTRASGYNLATTAERDGNRLIGIVLGGRSGATRNRHMEEILNNAFKSIEKRPTLISSVHRVRPVPSLRPDRQPSEPDRMMLAALSAHETPAPERSSLPAVNVEARTAPKTILGRPDVTDELALLAAAGDTDLLEDEAPYGEGDADLSMIRDWIVQVGAFGTQPQAIAQIHATQETVRTVWGDVGREVNIAKRGEDQVYRARFTRLTEDEAMDSCAALRQTGTDCLILQLAQ